MILGSVQQDWQDHFFLSTEEYLHSLISLVNELVRVGLTQLQEAAPPESD